MLDTAHLHELHGLADTVVTVARGVRFDEEIADADGVILGFGVPFDRAAIDSAPQLRYLGIASTAFDVVDTAYATARDITVTTLPEYTTEPVAQFVLAVMLEQASGLMEGRELRRSGNLFPLAYPARQFKNSTVAVVGLGTIGARVAEMAHGLGAHVCYWSRRRKDESGYRYQDLDTLLAEADFISINLALTEQTAGILNAERIAAIKPGAIVVCVAPLALIDLAALRERLAKGDIRVVLNHALADTIAEFRDYPNFIYPPVVYLSPTAHTTMQDLVIANLRGTS